MRPPIKEQLGLAIGHEGAGGYYVELSLDGFLVAAGIHQPAPDQVDRLRRAVDDGRTRAGSRARSRGRARPSSRAASPRSSARRAAIRPITRAGACCATGADRVAPPRARPWLHRPQACARIRKELEAAAPLVRWLREYVGPSQRA